MAELTVSGMINFKAPLGIESRLFSHSDFNVHQIEYRYCVTSLRNAPRSNIVDLI